MPSEGIGKEVYDFVVNNFLFGHANGLTYQDSLLAKGVIDSTGVLELVLFLKEHFNIRMDDDEIVPANLDSIQNVVNYVGRKSATQQ